MSHIYALVNQKGGVGKTTTTINLGAYLASSGKRVLLIDTDPQANATSCLGVDKRKVEGGVYSVLIDDSPVPANILHNPKLKLDLLPSLPALAGGEVELVSRQAREGRLKNALAKVTREYDYILIDCPPGLGLLTLNALVAAHGVIIPVQCEYLALEGLGQLISTINRVRSSLNPTLAIRGLLMTMYDSRASLANQVVEEVRRHFPGKAFNAVIPRSVRLAEAPSHGQPISTYAPSSTGGIAYRALADEVLTADDGRAHPHLTAKTSTKG
ncbi:MAG: ParA family protein [Chloroflexi bacterium]|nr:ParA family protein [Chloroflexota bacterium]